MSGSNHRNLSLRRSAAWIALAAAPMLGGCVDEELEIYDLVGSVVLPREAATQTVTVVRPVLDENGDPVFDGNGVPVNQFEDKTITDVRMIGPVYIGLFPDLDFTIQSYPHPSLGPVFQGADDEGDTFPYGGTTIGDIRFACLEFLTCKVVSGRFVDFEDLLSWFNETLETPIVDAAGSPIETGDFIRQTCYDILEFTSDEEIRVTVTKDRNGDGELDKLDLDFVEQADGSFKADFTIYQAEFFQGMTAWAWLDTPFGVDYNLSTCNRELGYQEATYTSSFRAGAQANNLLNQPYFYINDDDYVSTFGFEWNDPRDAALIEVDFPVGTGDISAVRAMMEDN